MAQNLKPNGSGMLDKVGSFFSNLLGSKKPPVAENRPGRGAPRNLANQHGMLPLEQETVMFSAYARRQPTGQQTLLLCSVDVALALELKSKLRYEVVVAETKQAMIDAVFSNSLHFIFLDFEPLKDGTLSFRLGKKVRATGYTGKIFLMGRSSKNDGEALVKRFGADGLVDKNFQEIADLLS